MTMAPRADLRIVGATPAEAPAGRYAARIRWRCAADPDWEIDTRHPGFESWREAACFANGLADDGASTLWLKEGALVLELVNGRKEVMDRQEAIVWQRVSPRRPALPEDLTFVRADVDLREMSAMGLDGAFGAMRFGVDDVRGSSRLDVRVEADARRRMVIVTLALPQASGDPQGADPAGPAFEVARA